MSISKQWVRDESNKAQVLALYRSKKLLTVEQVAEELATTFHNVSFVIRASLPEHERKTLAKLRYSKSKTGSKNPMKGKTREQHHNWQGECADGKGYLTVLHNGRRRFVHRVVMAEALGMPRLPKHWVVHHIDNNPKNNSIDNLALVTAPGHKAIHFLQTQEDSLLLRSRKSTIADALKYMT
jgi:hypothetical protein